MGTSRDFIGLTFDSPKQQNMNHAVNSLVIYFATFCFCCVPFYIFRKLLIDYSPKMTSFYCCIFHDN